MSHQSPKPRPTEYSAFRAALARRLRGEGKEPAAIRAVLAQVDATSTARMMKASKP